MLYHIETDERIAAGAPSTVYTLRQGSAGARAEIWPGNGFNCLRWWVATADGPKEVLYHAPEWLTNPVPTRSGIPILFPFPNRIRAGAYRYHGSERQLPLNDSTRQNAIHGFSPRHAWHVFGYSVDEKSAWIHGDFQPSRSAPEVMSLWPGDYLLSIIYHLTETTLRIESRVRNLGAQELPFGLGYHPYFRFPCADPDISRHRLYAPARAVWECIDNLPTGKKLPVPDEANWNRPRLIGSTQLDTLYSDLGSIATGHDGLMMRATLGHEDHPGSLQVWTTADFRESVLFTPPHRQAVCIEPYTCATDAINLQAKGVDAGWKTLPPGETWTGIVELRWDPVG